MSDVRTADFGLDTVARMKTLDRAKDFLLPCYLEVIVETGRL